MTAAVILYALSAALEGGGIAVTVSDIRTAQRRLADFIHRPRRVYAGDVGSFAEAHDPSVVTSEQKTVEQRVEDLETWKRTVPGEFERRDRDLTARLERRIQIDLAAAQRTVEDQLIEVREYLEGAMQSASVSYRGPVLLFVGVLVGLAANLVAVS